MATAHHFTPQPNRTYATRDNAIKAVQNVFGANESHFGSAAIWIHNLKLILITG